MIIMGRYLTIYTSTLNKVIRIPHAPLIWGNYSKRHYIYLVPPKMCMPANKINEKLWVCVNRAGLHGYLYMYIYKSPVIYIIHLIISYFYWPIVAVTNHPLHIDECFTFLNTSKHNTLYWYWRTGDPVELVTFSLFSDHIYVNSLRAYWYREDITQMHWNLL